LIGINKEPGPRGRSKRPRKQHRKDEGGWHGAGEREEYAARTCGVAVEAGCERVEAAADRNHEIRRDGHAGHQVLVYERLLLQLLVLRRPPV